jgi:hypothetical protein
MTDQTKSYRQVESAWNDDAELDDADKEPSLGSLERHPTSTSYDVTSGNQERWAASSSDDREHEHDGREEDQGM